jgi:pilus assembly protein CpaE
MPDPSGPPVIRVLVADEIAQIVQELEQLESNATDIAVCGVARREIDIATEAATQRPDVLLLRRGFAGSDAASVAGSVAAVSPGTRIVLLESAVGSGRGTPAGVAVSLPADADVEAIAAGVRQAALTAQLSSSSVLAPPEPPSNGHAAVEEPPIAEVPKRRQRRSTRSRGEVVLVFSGKGGVGKSLIATNLAVALAKDSDSHVALVDLNLQFGDVGVMLHIEHHPMAIEDLTQQGEELEPDFLDQVMATGPSDVRVLLAPSSPEYADLVTTASLRAILRELGKAYDYVIVDAPAYLEERVLETIELADLILLVTTFNITSVKNTKITIGLLSALGVQPDRLAVVLNQNRPRVAFTREEIEEILRVRVLAQLPYEPRVDESIDSGKVFIDAEPRAELSKQLRTVVEYLHTPEQPEEIAAPQRGQRPQRQSRRRFSLGRH